MGRFIPYGRQVIDEDDIAAVIETLQSDWLTTGPAVERFEQDVCDFTEAQFAVAVSSGTAALHAALYALGVSEGDEVIVPPLTFAATANAVLYRGGVPVFADVEADTLLIDPECVEALITPKTKAIIAVDYAGQPCNWKRLQEISKKYSIPLVADACHALGANYRGQAVGTLADITVFSFHPVKHITTGEGGMCVTNHKHLANSMRCFRSHGITTDARQREKNGEWFYEMTELGYNYRITDIQCALGSSQLKKLPRWVQARNSLARMYDDAFSSFSHVEPLGKDDQNLHAYHLYVVRVHNRDEVFHHLRKNNIGVNVHYIPVYLHPYYKGLGYKKGLCPVAEKAYESIITLPLWVGMSMDDVKRVTEVLLECE